MLNLKPIQFSGYYKEEFQKKQIYLHHTAGGPSGEPVYSDWENTPSKVATCVVIGRKGEIIQGFSSKYWAYHLGIKDFKINLDKISIGIELCNWGWLKKVGDSYFNYAGGMVTDIADVNFKGYQYYENYTDEQIESTRLLLIIWRDRYGIDISYKEDIWNICPRAFDGTGGLYTHNSVRKDKSDAYPHPKLVEMLQAL